MSREIKFRAWDTKRKEMIYKSRQNEYDDFFMLNLQGEFFGHTRTGDQWFEYGKDEYNAKDRFVLMQFTGLHDRNGKEIWEGDILQVSDPYGEESFKWQVQWSDDVAGWYLESPHGFSGPYDDYDTSTIGFEMSVGYQFKIIGNIYETPDLLTQEAP